MRYLYETDEESINEKDIQELFKVGITDYEMMQTLIEDTFGKKEGQDYSLLKGKNTRIVTIYSDDEEFLQLIEKSKAHKSKTTSRQRKGRVKVKVDAWKEKNKDPKDNIKNKKIYPKGKKDPKYIADKEKYDNDLDKFERDAWRDDIKKFPKDKK